MLKLFGQRKEANEINKVVLIPIKCITSNPAQPRKSFEPNSLRELSESIQANGLLTPIVVRKKSDDTYELVAGERRTLAFRALGREFIPAIIEDYTPEQSAVLSLIENLQRKDLNCFEEARAISKLMDELGLNQNEISRRLGKAQSTIANKLRLLRYSQDTAEKMLSGGLTERHARALLRIENEALLKKTIEDIIRLNLNVEQTESYIEKILTPAPPTQSKHSKRVMLLRDARIFQNTIKKAVDIMSVAGIPVQSTKDESDEFVEYTIKIPREYYYSYT
jgi:ParB family chromosome partitioning protein